jgi:hypothetical protein
MRNIWDFIYSRIGKHIEVDGIYPNQCVDLVKDYCRRIGLPMYHGDASNYQRGFHPEAFQWINNTPWNWPQLGDIVRVRGWNYDHIGICTAANRLTFDLFSQNFPTGNVCSIKRFNYISPRCLGWLRPRH